MGILDSKTRVIDAIITNEGRRQISTGNFKIEYVTFTDNATYYKADILSGSSSEDINRIILESNDLPQDQIVFEADDSGLLMPFKVSSNDYYIKNGQLLSKVLSGSYIKEETLIGQGFNSQIDGILESSIDNFKKLQSLATVDMIFEDKDFAISPNSVSFVINDKKPLSSNYICDVNLIDSLFSDKRLQNVLNFKYLPPINKTKDLTQEQKGQPLEFSDNLKVGEYTPFGPIQVNKKVVDNELLKELKQVEKNGYAKSLSIEPTSKNNNLLCQFFEINNNSVKKLDVIHYGNVRNELMNDLDVYFIGKVFVDDMGSHTFIHLFTIVFE